MGSAPGGTVPTVGVVVVSYHRDELTSACLRSLRASRWPTECLRVVVVDNGSAPGFGEELLHQYPAVELVASPTNVGFAAGCNLGFDRLVEVDHVALVNNDAVVEPGWLAPLVAALEADPAVGAAVPKVLLDDPVDDGEGPLINGTGLVLAADGYARDRGYLEPDRGQYDTPGEVFAWSGAAVALRRRYLDDVGLFDERFFLYYEDLDLAWRGRRRGWRYRYVPDAVVRHRHSAASVERSWLFCFYNERNRLLTLARNAPLRLVSKALLRYLLVTASYARRDVMRPLLRGLSPSLATVTVRLRALDSFLRLLPATLRSRGR